MPFQVGSLFAKVKIFIFRPKTMDYNPWFELWESEKSSEKNIPLERASQGECNSPNFSFVAPYSEELYECSNFFKWRPLPCVYICITLYAHPRVSIGMVWV